MPVPSRPLPTTKHSEQAMGNTSYDEDYGVNAVEILGEDNGNATLRRLQSDASGNLKVTVPSFPLPSGASTSANQDTQITLLQGIAGFTIEGYDYIALTYVAAGNGVGEIETATFKTGGAGGTTIAILTLTYNASNEIATVTKT